MYTQHHSGVQNGNPVKFAPGRWAAGRLSPAAMSRGRKENRNAAQSFLQNGGACRAGGAPMTVDKASGSCAFAQLGEV